MKQEGKYCVFERGMNMCVIFSLPLFVCFFSGGGGDGGGACGGGGG